MNICRNLFIALIVSGYLSNALADGELIIGSTGYSSSETLWNVECNKVNKKNAHTDIKFPDGGVTIKVWATDKSEALKEASLVLGKGFNCAVTGVVVQYDFAESPSFCGYKNGKLQQNDYNGELRC